MEVMAIATLSDGEENVFTFEMFETATNKEIVGKAFEIAYCKYINLDTIEIDSIIYE